MRAWYIREQRHILGTSDYAEVDLFETTDKEHLVAEPQHWRFIEHITPDTAEEIRKWKRLAEQAGKDSSWEKAGQGCQHSTGRASRMQ